MYCNKGRTMQRCSEVKTRNFFYGASHPRTFAKPPTAFIKFAQFKIESSDSTKWSDKKPWKFKRYV